MSDATPPTAPRLVALVTFPLDEQAAEKVAELAGPGAPVTVIAPSISSPLRYWTQDVSARRRAEEVLQQSIATLAAAGMQATGEVGDDDPLLALEDAVAVHRPAAVAIVTPPAGQRGWLELGLVPAARERLRVPVTHVVLGEGGTPAEEAGLVRRHPRRDAALLIVLAFAATFGSIVTFFMLSRSVDYHVLVTWAIFADVVPKALFAWAGWRLYLRRRHLGAAPPREAT